MTQPNTSERELWPAGSHPPLLCPVPILVFPGFGASYNPGISNITQITISGWWGGVNPQIESNINPWTGLEACVSLQFRDCQLISGMQVEPTLEMPRPNVKRWCRCALHLSCWRQREALELISSQMHMRLFITSFKQTAKAFFQSWP